MAQSITERLESLQRLRIDGALSEDEFQQLKQKLISEDLKGTSADRKTAAGSEDVPFLSRTIEIDLKNFAKKHVVLIAACAVALVVAAFPLINEGTGNECGALEGSLVRKVGQKSEGSDGAIAMGIVTLLQRASNGAFASVAIKKRYPFLPPTLGCMVGYYHAMWLPSDWGTGPDSIGNKAQTKPAAAPQEAPKATAPTTEASVQPPFRLLPSPRIRRRPPAEQNQNTAPPAPNSAPATSAISPDQGSDPLRPVMRTHTQPPYPPISIRLNEAGTSLIQVHITTDGTVDDCKVVLTSSSDRLDQAACDWVKSHWRWQPPTNQGAPIAVSTRVSVKWDLKDALSAN